MLNCIKLIRYQVEHSFTRNQVANFDFSQLDGSHHRGISPSFARDTYCAARRRNTLPYSTPVPVLTCGANGDRVQAFVGAARGTRSRHPRWDPQEQNGTNVATPILSQVRPSVANASHRTPAVRVAVEKPWGNRTAASSPSSSPKKARSLPISFAENITCDITSNIEIHF